MALDKALRTAAQGFFFFFFTCRLSAAEGGGAAPFPGADESRGVESAAVFYRFYRLRRRRNTAERISNDLSCRRQTSQSGTGWDDLQIRNVALNSVRTASDHVVSSTFPAYCAVNNCNVNLTETGGQAAETMCRQCSQSGPPPGTFAAPRTSC